MNKTSNDMMPNKSSIEMNDENDFAIIDRFGKLIIHSIDVKRVNTIKRMDKDLELRFDSLRSILRNHMSEVDKIRAELLGICEGVEREDNKKESGGEGTATEVVEEKAIGRGDKELAHEKRSRILRILADLGKSNTTLCMALDDILFIEDNIYEKELKRKKTKE